jgi:hypothetical protein
MSDGRRLSPGGCLGNVLIWVGIVWLVFAGLAGFGLMRETGSSTPIGFMVGSMVPAVIFILVGRAFKKSSRSATDVVVVTRPNAMRPAPPPPPSPTAPSSSSRPPTPPPPPLAPQPAPQTQAPGLDADDIHEDLFAASLADAMDDPLEPESVIDPEYDETLSSDDRPLTSEEMIEEAKRRLDIDDDQGS